MKKKYIAIYLFCYILFINCFHCVKNQSDTTPADIVSDKPAFTIGNVTITEYELEKNLAEFKATYKNQHNTEAGADAIEVFHSRKSGNIQAKEIPAG